jgi:hypothetical protein
MVVKRVEEAHRRIVARPARPRGAPPECNVARPHDPGACVDALTCDSHCLSLCSWVTTKLWGSNRVVFPVRAASSRWSLRRSSGESNSRSSSYSEIEGEKACPRRSRSFGSTLLPWALQYARHFAGSVDGTSIVSLEPVGGRSRGSLIKAASDGRARGGSGSGSATSASSSASGRISIRSIMFAPRRRSSATPAASWTSCSSDSRSFSSAGTASTSPAHPTASTAAGVGDARPRAPSLPSTAPGVASCAGAARSIAGARSGSS